MRYLIKTTEVYRVADEEEAKTLLEELKADHSYELAKYSSVKKERRRKGEVEDEWVQFTVTRVFNSEKEPCSEVEITYEVN